MDYNALSGEILDSCITVHKVMGPGLLESVYEVCLVQELRLRNIDVKNQVSLPLFYKGHRLSKDLKLDILVADAIILELKSVEILHPVYVSQIISYLKLADKRLGFLINFNVDRLKNGFHRYVNNF